MMTRFYLNGQTTHVFQLTKELIRQGHQVYLVANYLNHPDYLQWLKRDKIPFYPGANWNKLAKLAKAHHFDVIHSHSSHTLGPALEIDKKRSIPVVATCHYLDFEPRDELAQAHHIILISEEMKETLSLPPEKTTLIPNGIELPRQLVKAKPEIKAVTVLGRITPHKIAGIEELTAAVASWGGRLALVGDMPANLRPKSVKWQTNISPILTRSPILVGTGRAIREGMAHGCACLVMGELWDGLVTPANVGDLDKHNFSGRSSKTPPAREQILETLTELNPERIRKLGKWGFVWAMDNFSIELMAKRVTEVYAKNY